MTARGSSPTPEALKAEMRRALEKVAVEITRAKIGDGKAEREQAIEDAYQGAQVANRCLAALDLPSLRREAAAQVWDEIAAQFGGLSIGYHEDRDEHEYLGDVARARAAALREGR